MDFSTGNWRVREAVPEDVPDILQMIKVLKRKLKTSKSQSSPTSLVLTPNHNYRKWRPFSFEVKDYSLSTIVLVFGAMIDP